MTDRDAILSAITDPGREKVTRSPQFVFAELDLWAEFERRLGALGGRLIDLQTVKETSERPRWVERGIAEQLGFATNVPAIWDAEVGFSEADFAIAQTGTLVLATGPDRDRTSSLIPPVNVILVKKSNIVPTLNEAMGRLTQRTTVFVTGPSRTADIEGVLVRGVHGPGELLVYVQP